MIRVLQCKINPKKDNIAEHRKEIAKILRCSEKTILSIQIEKKSIDARYKPNVIFLYSFLVSCENEELLLKKNQKNHRVQMAQDKKEYRNTIHKSLISQQVVIIGAGPAGLFAAYELALAGYKPIVLERGGPMEDRVKEVEQFFQTGELNSKTNVVFGEGGAGTFSDGKLNTGVKEKSGRISFILKTFIECGAPEEIGYLAKPHIGTDILRDVIVNLRKKIEELGGTFHFYAKMEELVVTNDRIRGIVYSNYDKSITISAEICILAIGHGARDTFSYLKDISVPMQQKSFAVGVRVEHLQEDINEAQYGIQMPEYLPSADYKLTAKSKDGRGVYSFCMCPGGFVVNASSETGNLVVNGMSNHLRDEKNANSAIIVTVDKNDFPDDDVLAGVTYQKQLEEKAWKAANGKIPVQRLEDFRKNQITSSFGRITPVTKGLTEFANVRAILPEVIGDAILDGFDSFGRKIKGFDDKDTLLSGVETRTSSPVRILRNELMQSSISGLYPCGEGAGYAGGIISAAVDGLKVASQIRKNQEDECI